MPTVWFALKRSMHCKSSPTDVHDPKSRKHLSNILTKKIARSGCSRSIANLKDVVIHGSKRHLDRPPSCSPRSIGSSDFLNPITHEVILSNSRCELKITSFDSCGGGGGRCGSDSDGSSGGRGGGGSVFVGTLRPGTPGPGGNFGNPLHHFNPSYTRSSSCVTPSRKSPFLLPDNEGGGGGGGGHLNQHRGSFGAESDIASSSIACPKCGEKFSRWEAVESHHLSQHAVTELVEGDSSRKIVEIICRTSYLKAENPCGRIEKVLKVHNMQKTLARFEDYRESVKMKASKLPKKHPRCLADGNELLRFYGTTISCSIGLNGCSSLCIADKCCVCRIIRNGFSAKKELKDGIGVFTTSTSGRAFEMIETIKDSDASSFRKALIVCRVIAGRVHKQLENIQEIAGQSGFDSLAGKVGLYSNIEELYLLNPKALLPCFVVICKS